MICVEFRLIMNCDAGNKSYVDHVVNSIIDGSEPLQGDVSMNNNRIKNVHTTVSDYDTVNLLFCDVKYLKKTDGYNFLMKISNDRRQDAKDKMTTDLKTAQYDDEAVNLSQLTDVTNKKVDMENLIPQAQNRLLIPDYNSGNFSDQDAINKSYVDSRAFDINLSSGLDLKGTKLINLGDATNLADGRNKRYVDVKTNNCFEN